MAGTIGVRAEDKSRWERRVPLVPDDLRRLAGEHPLRFVVEPSQRRIYDDAAFRAAGAELSADLGAADVVFAVKEVPREKLLAGKAYVFFAHVIKGQAYNMPLLRRLLGLGCTLIDYERITDDSNRRLVLFGREAGQAGMIETLHALGRRLQADGFTTPLAEIRQAYAYDDLADAKAHVLEVGQHIRRHGLEIPHPPMVVGFTGKGHVSHGAWEIFDLLPHEDIEPSQLATLAERHGDERDRLFKVCFQKRHLAEPKSVGATFDEREYRSHPERYRGCLAQYLPYLTVLVNGIYWTDRYPRFFTREQARAMWRAGQHKLTVVGDITCDIDGAVELTCKATQPDAPTYVYDAEHDTFRDGVEGPGIVVLAVDNLPCELPRDASDRFSHALRDFVPAIAAADYGRPFAELDLPPEIRRAVVTHRGELTPDYRYLERYLG